MAEILDEGAGARKASMKLQGVEYAGELAVQMQRHTKSMENWYTVFHTALSADPPKPTSWFEDNLQKVEKKRAWYTKSKAGSDMPCNLNQVAFYKP